MLLNIYWIHEEIKEELKKYLKTWKWKPRGRFIVILTYLKKQTNKKSQINNLTLYPKESEKEGQSPKSGERRK